MSRPLRVAVFNDSATVRASLRAALATAPDFVVAAERSHGDDAARTVAAEDIDVVIMDVVMPGVSGFEATRAIMRERPTPIIMVSSVVDPRDREVIFAALEAGALHIAEPPPAPGTPRWGLHAASFLELLRTIAGARVRGASPRPSPGASDVAAEPPGSQTPLGAIGIVSSAGGPQALMELLSLLPAGRLAPVLLVQHIADGFAESFARWLNAGTPHEVRLARDGEAAQTGLVYVAPDQHHLWLSRERRLVVCGEAPLNGFRPSGDLLFCRLGEELGARAMGVVLSGMGRDGAGGALELKLRGGRVVSQADPVIDGMPSAALATGAVEASLSIPEVARWLRARSGRS